MPTIKIKVGDLVYIPSDVTLFNESETYKLKKPTNLLITGRRDNLYEVYYLGNYWYVKDINVYGIESDHVKAG
jgi:hypothetical protein